MSKQCFKCLRELSIDQFYKHKAMADGHLNKCKECAKRDVLEHRAANLNEIREYDRERGRLQHRVEARREYYERTKNDPSTIAVQEASNARWKSENPMRRKAHEAVNNAVRDGRLEKLPCEKCGSEDRVHGHHEDYNKPLEVTWMCPTCHGARHRELNEMMRNGVDLSEFGLTYRHVWADEKYDGDDTVEDIDVEAA